MVKAKEQKQKEVDELVARDLECKEAAETVKKLELEVKEKEAKEKEQKEIEKELKKKEAVEAERDALQTNLADLNKTKDHLLKTIEKLRSEQKSVQDEIKLLDAPLENQVIETKTERQESIANSRMGKITKEVDKLKQKRNDDVDDAKVFEQNDEETNEVSEPSPTLIDDAPAVVDQDEKEVESEPAAAAEVPVEIDEPVAETVQAVEEPVTENEIKTEIPIIQEDLVSDEPLLETKEIATGSTCVIA